MNSLSYSGTVYYSITVSNAVPKSIVEILSNFYQGKLVCKKQKKGTVLKGLVKDQAALSGLLTYLSDLHYIILSVEARE